MSNYVRVFHGITAVAELKPNHMLPSNQTELSVFHGITAVAELKRWVGGFLA